MERTDNKLDEIKYTDLVTSLEEKFQATGTDFKSKTFKSVLFSKFNTKLRTSSFRGWTFITLRNLKRRAIPMPLPPVKHKYAVKLDGSDKNFVYQYSPSVSANVSTTNGIVTGATINGSRIEKANVFSLDRILQVLVNCDVCDQRRSGGCLKLLSKFRKDSALQSCSKCHQQLTRRVLADRSNTIQAQSGWCVSNNGVRPIQNSFCAKIVFFLLYYHKSV